jgi:hypothetical protein
MSWYATKEHEIDEQPIWQTAAAAAVAAPAAALIVLWELYF